ncbi:BRAP2 RING ZnF UBP domain-containing protein 1-like isoform X1 [Eucalyptus grandis]|uniref:BRAP2 RING ZnF UBP domain-containing protein 1-like isoform X1 n=1 Tax=Eucalyptus grandis TaxID=71139 RepID=UPI00192F0EEB|nr:BRAP2 RING ZnF UBP domain-containing protein 1-like isoform X1 [Eucalyptus grandis]
MFFLRVHSVDTDHPLATDDGGFSSSSPPPPPPPPTRSPRFTERRGMVHLFRTLSHAPLSSPGARSTTLFVVAVPNYFSPDDFIRFCGPRVDDVSELRFIRNDGMEDRYSVLIELTDQKAADGFYCTFNGQNFSPAEVEVCHILYLHEVDYTESADVASTPPSGFAELLSCPVCLERLDPDTSGILSTHCDHSFHCSCGTKWTYLSCQVCRLCQQQDEVPSCFICGTMENLWVCLICGFEGCGRYKDKHAISHWKNTQHCYSLDLRTQQICDYVGDTYVHRLNQSKADGKLLEMNSYCESPEGDCGSCGCSEDSEISGVLFSSKIEAIHTNYIHLASTQLEAQRKHYESLMLEAKSRKENSKLEAIEKAVTSKIEDIHSKLGKLGDEKKAVAELNQTLIKSQDIMWRKVKEIEERKTLSLKSKDEQILDLEEQIRDLKVYIGAQKTLDKMNDEDGVKGGTLLPVPLEQSTSARKSKKPSRRRK